jgi:hypothetical protein
MNLKTILRRAASFVAISTLGLFAAATVAAANPHTMYTCVKVKQNGQQDVQVNVPEPAVSGLTNAGFTCVATPAEEEGDDQGDQGDQGDEGDQGAASGENVEPYVAPESRTLFCSTNGPAYRANGDGMGIALNLPDSAGAAMVALGLVKPATFYQGIGATCDQLPGFKDSGLWVDHVGDVVPGVAVYPLFVTA